MCVTHEEILVWDHDQQTIRQRLPRPTGTLPESTRWIAHPAGLLVLAPPQMMALLDVVVGEWQLIRDTDSLRWQAEIGWDARRLMVHPQGQGCSEIWDLHSGRTLRREHPATSPWRTAPLFFGDGDDFITLQENDRLIGSSTVPARRWEFVGLMSSTIVSPWVFARGDDCYGLIEGQRLVRIQTDTGWPRWSTMLADRPLRHPSAQTAVCDGVLYAAASGRLTAVNLASGAVLWTSALSLADERPKRCVALGAGQVLAVLPAAPSSTDEPRRPVETVELFAADSGRRIQSLRLNMPAQTVDIAPTGGRNGVLVTEHVVLGLQRP